MTFNVFITCKKRLLVRFHIFFDGKIRLLEDPEQTQDFLTRFCVPFFFVFLCIDLNYHMQDTAPGEISHLLFLFSRFSLAILFLCVCVLFCILWSTRARYGSLGIPEQT